MNIGDSKYEILKSFADFLIEHQILDSYVFNLSKEPDLTSETFSFGFFSSAFAWNTTSEGSDFWFNFDDQWLESEVDSGPRVTWQEILDFLTSPSPIEPPSPQSYEDW